MLPAILRPRLQEKMGDSHDQNVHLIEPKHNAEWERAQEQSTRSEFVGEKDVRLGRDA
jgi:hypothetical protein